MTEFEKLAKRITEDFLTYGFIHQSISPGPDWYNMDLESKAKAMNDLFSNIDEWKNKEPGEKLYIRAREAYDAAHEQYKKYFSAAAKDWLEMSDGEIKARKAWQKLEFPLMHLRQELEAYNSLFNLDGKKGSK